MRMVARRIVEAYNLENDTQAELEACESQIASLEKEQHNLTKAAMKGFVNDEMVTRNEELKAKLRELHNRRGILMSEAAGFTEDEIVEFLAHGFDRSDEDFIFKTFTNKVYLFNDCMLAVFNFRDEVGDLAEVRISLEQYLRKNGNHNGFPSLLAGVPSTRKAEPLVLKHGFGLLIPLVKAA